MDNYERFASASVRDTDENLWVGAKKKFLPEMF